MTSSSSPSNSKKKSKAKEVAVDNARHGERKRGALSDEERLQIRRMVKDNFSIKEIADALNRNTDPIIKFIDRENLVLAGSDEETIERTNLRNKLMSRHYWNDVKRQFNEAAGELNYFIESWINYMLQFGEDVTFSEELQTKDIITVDILISRSMQERNLAIQYIEQLQRELDKLHKIDDPNDAPRIQFLEEQINLTRSTLGEYTTEYSKLLDKKKDLNRDLKMTRDQRVKKIEDSNSTFANYIKSLEEEDARKRTGEQIELMRVAKERAKKRLGELHIFGDGKGDLPFLTPELYEEYIQKQELLEEKENGQVRQENSEENSED